jgi:hypothetical protein
VGASVKPLMDQRNEKLVDFLENPLKIDRVELMRNPMSHYVPLLE